MILLTVYGGLSCIVTSSDMIVYDSHICIFIKRDSLKTPSTENKNVNKEKYVNKETIVFLRITKHFNKVDSPLAIPVTFFLWCSNSYFQCVG